MESIYRDIFKALMRRWFSILVVCAVAGALAVTKELLVPGVYTADVLLVVTGVTTPTIVNGTVAKPGTTEILPAPFNPKAYEQLLTSNTVLGKTLEKLTSDKVWPEGEAPLLEDFRHIVNVDITIVDETTRPVNYSPILRLSAIGETDEQAVKIVNAWAEVAMEKAQRAISMKVGAPAKMLKKQKDQYESGLEFIWEELRTERAVWNLDVLRTDLDNRVKLQMTLLEKRSDAARNLAMAQEQVRLLQEEGDKLIETERGKYATESGALRDEMVGDMREANLPLLQDEMSKQLTVAVNMDQQNQELERQIQGLEQRLIAIQTQLTQEKPFLELGKAPSETAFWIVEGEKTKSLTDLQSKVMVTQEINPVYQELKKTENDTIQGISQKKAELEAVKVQMETCNALLKQLREKYGQHTMAQGRISNDLDVSEKRFSLVGADESVALVKLKREAMMQQAGAQAQLTTIDRQLADIQKDQDTLKQQIAEHAQIQTRLQSKEDIARAIFNDIASTESFMGAAYDLASGRVGDDQAVGLNRLSSDTYALIDKGLLGRKGRVIVTTMIAFVLMCGFVVLRDVGLKQLRIWLKTID